MGAGKNAEITIIVDNVSYPLEELCVGSLDPSLLPFVANFLGVSLKELTYFDYCVYTVPIADLLSGNYLSGEVGKTYYLKIVSEGKTFTLVPTATDRLMAHLVWGLPLSAADLPTGPGGYYVWERMPDGGGRLREETFDLDQATPSELRQIGISLRERKREFRNMFLKTFLIGMTWKDRWQEWNKMFPDLAFSSPDAMRKCQAYWKDRF